MKNIHEILAAHGLTVPEDKKAEFERELAANYRTIADYEKQTGKVEQLTKDLNTAKAISALLDPHTQKYIVF